MDCMIHSSTDSRERDEKNFFVKVSLMNDKIYDYLYLIKKSMDEGNKLKSLTALLLSVIIVQLFLIINKL
jgi:hypothetical protein